MLERLEDIAAHLLHVGSLLRLVQVVGQKVTLTSAEE